MRPAHHTVMSTDWRHHVTDLRAMAQTVYWRTSTSPTGRLSARAVACALSGILSLVARRFSMETMQQACRDIARHHDAWRVPSMAKMPVGVDGAPTQAVEMIAWTARGLFQVAEPEAIRAALAYWATESSPSSWNEIIEIAA